MPNYGVIDLGSNTVRLVIYQVKDDRKKVYTNKDFRSLISDKVMAGLAAHVEEGVFQPSGVKRAVEVLKGHAKRAAYFQCARIDVFATAVLRNCANSAEAVAAIEAGTGLSITLLSAADEAHLGFVGATCDRVIERGTLMDIGGGSTELTRIDDGGDSTHASLPFGSLSAYATCVAGILPTEREISRIAQTAWDCASDLPHAKQYRAERFYGIGGSVRAAAKMHAQMTDGIRPRVLTMDQFGGILDYCCTHPNEFAHGAVKAVPERIHTLVPGTTIAHAIASGFGAFDLEICKYGVREGYLVERMLESTVAH